MAKHLLTLITVEDNEVATELGDDYAEDLAVSVRALAAGWQVIRGGITLDVSPVHVHPRYLWVLKAIAAGNFEAPHGA